MPEPRSLRRHFPTAGREKFLPTAESCGAGGASPAGPAAPQRPLRARAGRDRAAPHKGSALLPPVLFLCVSQVRPVVFQVYPLKSQVHPVVF